MIIASIVLVLVAVALLALGTIQGSESLYYASIVSSTVAALALIFGVRRSGRARAAEELEPPLVPALGPPAAPATMRTRPAVGRVATNETTRAPTASSVYVAGESAAPPPVGPPPTGIAADADTSRGNGVARD